MSDLTFVRFVETNEHEAETWAWWLQLDGNKAQLDRLARLLREAAATSPYFDDFAWSLYLDDVEPEPIVDKLVQYADLGYYAAHNKVTGVFSCPDELGKGFGNLYKGRIRDYFTPALADADAVRLVPAAGPTDPPGDAEGRSGTPGEDSTGELRALRTVEKLSMDRDRLDAAIKAIAARIWSESHVSSRPRQCEALEEIARDLRDLARRPAETPTPPGEVDHG